MTEYKAKSTETLIFNLTKNDNLVGKMTYKNWLSYKANILLADNSTFEIEPKGFWGTTIEVKNRTTLLLQMTMNWENENVRIESFGNQEQNFVFKHYGNLKQTKFCFVNANNQDVLTIALDGNCTSTNYEYNISTNEEFETIENKDILVFASVYLLNSYVSSTEILLSTAVV